MNNNVLFECLCSDLNVKLRRYPSAAELGGLKDRLLQLAESQFPWFATDRFLEDAAQIFAPTGKATSVADLMDAQTGSFKSYYQLLCWGLKIRKPYTEQQEKQYIDKFLDIEKENSAYRVDRSNPVTRFARLLCRRTFHALDLSAESIARWCRHGPGATFDREVGSDKNVFVIPPSQLTQYATWDMFFPNVSWAAEESMGTLQQRKLAHGLLEVVSDKLSELDNVIPVRKRFLEARLTLVPKTYKGPRGVFISPKEAMFWQLAQDTALKRMCDRTWISQCYSPVSQEPSQALALSSSYSRWSATLDLSDASDRVPLSLVAFLFHRPTYLALARTRPCFVWLPDGRRHRLSMFGPMGDGKTFPILTIICLLLSVSAISIALYGDAAVPTEESVVRASYGVRVFGDDIIVPAEYYDRVVAALQAHNLKVNVTKSFNVGRFRESCGMDAFDGKDVTPIRQKEDFDDDNANLDGAVALHNACVMRRYVKTATVLRQYIGRRWYGMVGLTTNHWRNPHAMLTFSDKRKACHKCSDAAGPNGLVHAGISASEGSQYAKCMWCGSFGLISQLESLHVRWRLNVDTHLLEQLIATPEPENYGFDGDSWWNLAYALWPKQQVYPDFGVRRTTMGSREEAKAWESACRAMRIRCDRSYGGGFRLRWVPLS